MRYAEPHRRQEVDALYASADTKKTGAVTLPEFAKFIDRMKAVAGSAEAKTEAAAASVTEQANLLRLKAMAATEALLVEVDAAREEKALQEARDKRPLVTAVTAVTAGGARQASVRNGCNGCNGWRLGTSVRS